MKNFIIPIFFICLFVSCKEISNVEQSENLTSLDVNFYKANPNSEEINVPQLTLKTDQVQITGIGNNIDGVQQQINKIYLSDTDTQTEWIVLLDDLGPKFFYGINSQTQEKLPFLYWLVEESEAKYILRFYEYDWMSRLGTLQYEVEVNNDDLNVIFDNSSTQKISNDSNKRNQSLKKSQSFPAPIIEFDQYKLDSIARRQNVINDETIDEQFDRQVKNLMNLFQETKTKTINIACNVSKILNKSDKNFVCKLSDQVNKVTDEKIFNDLSTATEETQDDDSFDFEGISSKFNIDFFDDFNITENIKRHLNDVRGFISDNFNFNQWIEQMKEFSQAEAEDLDDLSNSNGVIQVGLSWNTTADIDLHVTDPFGEEIYYENPSSESGGYLDLDDTDGFGPENIYWTENVPDGTYTVSLVYYGPESGPVTDYNVKVINGLGVEETFTGSLGYFENNKVTIVTFRKNGNQLSF